MTHHPNFDLDFFKFGGGVFWQMVRFPNLYLEIFKFDGKRFSRFELNCWIFSIFAAFGCTPAVETDFCVLLKCLDRHFLRDLSSMPRPPCLGSFVLRKTSNFCNFCSLSRTFSNHPSSVSLPSRRFRRSLAICSRSPRARA